MLFNRLVSALLVATVLVSCSSQDDEALLQPSITASTLAPSSGTTPASIGLVGSASDVSTTTTAGAVLMGGSTDVDEAIEWMIAKSGGGDFVVLRATGGAAYNDYIYNLGTVNSVETLLIDSRLKANDAITEATIRNAEAVFIAGGDQYDYVSFWKDTKVEAALNYLANTKKVPVGGTSAGCAIQGKYYYTAQNGTIRSEEALANPFDRRVTIQRNNFLDNDYLDNTITDTHYDDPDRRGRHLTFMARMRTDYNISPRGIGVDEKTAVCIDQYGKARVYGYGYAFFLQESGGTPERCTSRRSLDWYRSRQAVRVYKIQANSSGNRYFSLNNWTQGSGGSWQYHYVDYGTLGVN